MGLQAGQGMVNTEDSKTVLFLDDPNRRAAACLLPPWPPMTRGLSAEQADWGRERTTNCSAYRQDLSTGQGTVLWLDDPNRRAAEPTI